MFKAPRWVDAVALSISLVLITFHPYYLRAELNLYELGLYLPGIDAILQGKVPFRDFFHLRGPFELYPPAFLMKIFGEKAAVLSTYFYIGTVFTLVVGVWLAQKILRTRLLFYLFVPVFIARTFPRVVFTFWGGMRYAVGLLAIYFAVRYFREERNRFAFWAGFWAAVSFFTSVEIGVCALAGVGLGFLVSWVFKTQKLKVIVPGVLNFSLGVLIVSLPFIVYLGGQGALGAFVDTVYTVITRMQVVVDMHAIASLPRNLFEAAAAMLNPGHDNFKHLTPAYFYLFLAGYFIWKIKNKGLNHRDLGAIVLAGYGAVMYNAAFRNIGGSQFEMALQPQKLLYFYFLEVIVLNLWGKRQDILQGLLFGGGALFKSARLWKVQFIHLFVAGVVLSSVIYPIARFSHRFFSFKFLTAVLTGKDVQALKPLKDEGRESDLPRLKGSVLSKQQAEELEEAAHFIQANTNPGEPVVMYPELGAYNFIAQRPFVGRFPIPTFSWFKESWHAEFMRALQTHPPPLIVLDKDPGATFSDVFLKRAENAAKHSEFLDYLKANYAPVKETREVVIYKKN